MSAGWLPRPIWPGFDPVSPDEVLCDLLNRDGNGWIVEEWEAKAILHAREDADEITVAAKCELVEAGRTGAIHFYAYGSEPTLHRVPKSFFDKAGFSWLEGTLHALLNGVPISLDGASVLSDRSAAQAWLESRSPPAVLNPSNDIAPGWTEERMKSEISSCSIGNRDKAWAKVFKPLIKEHGWDNTAFRSVWAAGRGTKGLTGRPAKRA